METLKPSKFDSNQLGYPLNCTTCGREFEFFGSAFCSRKCYEDYFVPKIPIKS